MGYSYYYEPRYAEYGLSALLTVVGVIFAIFALMLVVLQVIAYWKLFQKAGQPGWKALIPVYSDYVLYGIAWKKTMFWIYLAVGIVSSIPSMMLSSAVEVMAATGSATVLGVAGIALGLLLTLACTVVVLVIEIMFCVHLSRSFGHGGGYAVGLLLLPTIFKLILGLGNSQYQKKVKTRDEQTIV
jgi:hypothetical protein